MIAPWPFPCTRTIAPRHYLDGSCAACRPRSAVCAGLSALLLLFFIFFLIRWCRASRKKKRKARRGSGLAREMLAASGDSRTSVPKTTVNMQNLSSITSFSDCGKQASSPLLNSSGFSPIYNGVPPEQRDLYRPSAGSSRQAATPHVAVGSSSDAGVFKVRSVALYMCLHISCAPYP